MSKTIDANTIILNGGEYIRKDAANHQTIQMDSNMCIIRCRNAGVHAGTIGKRADGFLEVTNSRRLWKWVSKATLSELATEGPLKPDENKYGCVLPILRLNIDDVCEIIPCSSMAAKKIAEVPVWEA